MPVPAWLSHLRRFPLDGALLLFDRDTGLCARCEGEETRSLKMTAPRAVQFAITNRCNLDCSFCSRDQSAESGWTAERAFGVLAGLARAGVLEVAFGGGEPFAFRGFPELVRRLREETPLAIHATTNGTLLNEARLSAAGRYLGELRLSVYDDIDWKRPLSLLKDAGIRFGVNWLVSPGRLQDVETTVFDLIARGCRDVLLLRYKGPDKSMHLTVTQTLELAKRVRTLARAVASRCVLKLDVCWDQHMGTVPRLFSRNDCGAGREFLVISSDSKVLPCSFHHQAIPFRSAEDVLRIWREERQALRAPAKVEGCPRAPLEVTI